MLAQVSIITFFAFLVFYATVYGISLLFRKKIDK